jgi:hypothetical protein
MENTQDKPNILLYPFKTELMMKQEAFCKYSYIVMIFINLYNIHNEKINLDQLDSSPI